MATLAMCRQTLQMQSPGVVRTANPSEAGPEVLGFKSLDGKLSSDRI